MKFPSLLEQLEEKVSNKLIDTHKKPGAPIVYAYKVITEILCALNWEMNFGIKDPEMMELQKRRSTRHVFDSVIVGGGSLAEAFIEGYQGQSKDIDIFVDSGRASTGFPKSSIKERVTPFENLFLDELNRIGTFEKGIKTAITENNYNAMLKVQLIIQGSFSAYPEHQVELILVEDLRVSFDLTFREFYYLGKTVLATEKALQDIRERKISFNHLETRYSSYVRAEEFAERYGFSIDPATEEWLFKYEKYLGDTHKEESTSEWIESRMAQVKKYVNPEKTNRFIQKTMNASYTEQEKRWLQQIEHTIFNGPFFCLKRFTDSLPVLCLPREKEKMVIKKPRPHQIKLMENGAEREEFSADFLHILWKDYQLAAKKEDFKNRFQADSQKPQSSYLTEILKNHRDTYGITPENYSIYSLNRDDAEKIYHQLSFNKRLANPLNQDKIYGFQRFEDYFGKEEHIVNYLHAQEMQVEFDMEAYVFKKHLDEETVRIDFTFTYTNEKDEPLKKFWLIKNKISEDFYLNYSGDHYVYWLNQRYEDIENQLKQAISTMKMPTKEEFLHETFQLTEFDRIKNFEHTWKLLEETKNEIKKLK